MMEYALLLAAASLGVDYGWQRTDDGSLEYIIQLEPALLQSLAEGEPIISEVHPDVRGVRRFRIVVGANRLPREPVAPSMGEVGRPPTSPSGAPLPGPEPVDRTTLDVGRTGSSRDGGASDTAPGDRRFPDAKFRGLPTGDGPSRERRFPADQPPNAENAPPLIGAGPRFRDDAGRSADTPAAESRSEFQPWSPPASADSPEEPTTHDSAEEMSSDPAPPTGIGRPDAGAAPRAIEPPSRSGSEIRPIADPDRSNAAPIGSSPIGPTPDFPLIEPPRRLADQPQRDPNVQLAGGLQSSRSVEPEPSRTPSPPDQAKPDSGTGADETAAKAEGRPWWGWTLALLALIVSLVLNGYLGLLARGFYTRYRELAAEIRSAPAVETA